MIVIAIAAAVYTTMALSSQLSLNVAMNVKTQIASAQPGALVNVGMKSQVGILLDEIPLADRDLAVNHYTAASEDFWTAQAKDQIKLMAYRLVFRSGYYDANESKGSLPLPPESLWKIHFTSIPYRSNSSGHDLLVRNYTFASTLLSPKDSPGQSEPALNATGGHWEEPFILPIDPELLFQRTGYACMDENQFPPKSVDPEEVDTFYDQETAIGGDLSIKGVHESVMPDMSCTDALDAKIGKIKTSLNFDRVEWNPTIADSVRVGKITNPIGPDLITEDSEFKENRVVYRYITPHDCAVVEGSVGATGWRKLLQFSAADRNFGAKNLDIGSVDYFIDGNGTDLSKRGIFEFSPCHNHYHFAHYGSFTLGNKVANHKMGFCLQSTNRFSNNEFSPLANDYSGCGYQGIEAGWVDEYKAGLEGQWVDITGIDSSNLPSSERLMFHSNPDGFLCEGTPVLDKNGSRTYEPTAFRTSAGDTVYRPMCNFAPGALENDVDSYNVTIPVNGEGYVTLDCAHEKIGPLRNCGFKVADNNHVLGCTPSQDIRLEFTVPNGSASQILRVCQYSEVLSSGVACTYNGPYNSQSIGNYVVASGSPTIADIQCPGALDYNEPGGKVSLYSAPLLPFEAAAPVQVRVIG